MTPARSRACLLGGLFVVLSVVLFTDSAPELAIVAIFGALMTGGWLISDLAPATRIEEFSEGCPSCGHTDQTTKRRTCPHAIEGGASGWGPEERCGCDDAFHRASVAVA